MTKSLYEENLRICAFRIITSHLAEKNLITREEAAKIRKQISVMETDLIKASSSREAEHLREQIAA